MRALECQHLSVSRRSTELKRIFLKELKPHVAEMKTARDRIQKAVDGAKVGPCYVTKFPARQMGEEDLLRKASEGREDVIAGFTKFLSDNNMK